MTRSIYSVQSIVEGLKSALHSRYQRKPIEDALVSLSEAITLAACRLLDIDPRELGNGSICTPTERDSSGYFSF